MNLDMEAARQYVASLKTARAKEGERRAARRQLRNEFLAMSSKEHHRRSRALLQQDIRQHMGYVSTLEQSFFDALQHPTAWWRELCQSAIDGRLRREEAAQRMAATEVKHMENICNQEMVEMSHTVDSDVVRLNVVRENMESRQRNVKQQVIADVLACVLHRTEECMDFMQRYSLDNTRTSMLTQLVVPSKVSPVVDADSPRRYSLQDAFRIVFGRSPFCMTSHDLLLLLACMYKKCDKRESPMSRFEVCSVPLFIIHGTKFSGKSRLSSHLVDKFDYVCYSDVDLIQRALDSYHAECDTLAGTGLQCCPHYEATVTKPAGRTGGEGAEGTDFEGDAGELESGASNLSLTATQTGGALPLQGTPQLSQWASLGRRIAQILYSGGAVDSDLMSELQVLILQDVPEGCKGILFNDAVSDVVTFKEVQKILWPRECHPYEEALSLWRDRNGRLFHSPLSLSEVFVDAQTEPWDSDEDMPESLMIRSLHSESDVVPIKKEGRSKVGKRNAPPSVLPPLELPEIDDLQLRIVKEKAFIAAVREHMVGGDRLCTGLLHIQCSPREVFERFAGLRVDRETGLTYHMVYQPPPADRLPFLESAERNLMHTAHMHNMVFVQQQVWQRAFSLLERHPSLMEVVHEVDGEQPLENMQLQAEAIIAREEGLFARDRRLHEAIRAAEARLKELKDVRLSRVQAREETQKRLRAAHRESGPPAPNEPDPTDSQAFYFIPSTLPQQILDVVVSFSRAYARTYEWVVGSARDLVMVLLEYRFSSVACLQHYWEEPDNRQTLLDHFVEKFNGVPHHLRRKVPCKEELHTYVDEVSQSLHNYSQARRQEYRSAIDQVTRRDTFLDGWEANVYNLGSLLAQVEMERFVVMANLVQLYFTSLVGIPFVFEGVEIDGNQLRTNADTPTVDPSATNSKFGKEGARRVTTSKRNISRTLEEGAERTMEEQYVEMVGRLIQTMGVLIDKVRVSADVANRAPKKGGPPSPSAVKQQAAAAKAYPFLEAELKCTRERLVCVQEFVTSLLHQGPAYVQALKEELLSVSQRAFLDQASATSTAVYHLRCAIEEESCAPRMHLGCGTFAVLDECEMPLQVPSLPSMSWNCLTKTGVTNSFSLLRTNIHDNLTAARLLDLVWAFRTLAPNYQLGRDDFAMTAREEDYAAAGGAQTVLKSLSAVFRAFDGNDTGFIDWREYIVHLLLWSAGPDVTSDRCCRSCRCTLEPSMEQIMATKSDFGTEFVSVDVFFEIPFFFDDDMDDHRLAAYTRVLWEAFHDPATELLDSFPLLGFLCADVQPVRGVQKAFTVLSAEGSGALTMAEMDRVFHLNATNPRAMALTDPFSKPNLRLLFAGDDTLTFDETCNRALGRKMLNCIDTFRRKSFVEEMDALNESM